MEDLKEILYNNAKINSCEHIIKTYPFLEKTILEAMNQALRIHNVVVRSEQLVTFLKWVGDGYDFENNAEKIVREYIDECSPIKLTDDILVKMGFTIQKGDWSVATHKVNTDFAMNDKIDGHWRFTPIWCKDYKPIIYVHELQNLYFCLFGEELPIA